LSAIRNRTITCLLTALIFTLLGPVSLASANGDTPQAISISNILGVTPPVAGATPVESITPTAQYTGSITWSDLNGPLVGNFQPSTIYKATITLSPAPGYEFYLIDDPYFFQIEGATNIFFFNGSGEITAIFNPVFADGTEKLDRSFNLDGTYKLSNIFGSNPLTESNTAVGHVEVDRIAIDSQDRTVVLASFYSDTANRTAIGTGFRNSLAIAAQSGNESSTSAAVSALSYRGGDQSDWFLPSINELIEMYLEGVIVGGLSINSWSSTEDSISYARIYDANSPEEVYAAQKSDLKAVRPIRGGTLTTPEIGDTGPGGGTIFYETSTAFACGPTLSETCNYLEAAPSNWFGGDEDPRISWSTGLDNQEAQVSIDHHILFRLNADGSHDNTFGNSSTTLRKDVNDTPKKYILITTTGVFYSEKIDLEVDATDRIYVMLSGSIPGTFSGQFHNLVARFNVNGVIDTNFGNSGAIGSLLAQEGPAGSLFEEITIDRSDKVMIISVPVWAPEDMIVERYLSAGELDESFGITDVGTSLIPIGYPFPESPSPYRNIKITADGSNGYILAYSGFFCIETQENPCPEPFAFTQLLRLNQSGALDDEFIIDNPFPDAPPNIVPGFTFTDLIPDGNSGFILSGTSQNPMNLEEVTGLITRLKLDGETDLEFSGPQDDYLLNPIASDNCINTAMSGSLEGSQITDSRVTIGEYCWDDSDAPPTLRLKNFLSSGEYQVGVTLPAFPAIDYLFSVNQLLKTNDGNLVVLTGAEPFAGFWGLVNQGYGTDQNWSEVEISRYRLVESATPTPSPTPNVVPAPIPSPIPYLRTVTSPTLRLSNGELICSAGTYNAGYRLNGVYQGSTTSLVVPLTFSHMIYLDDIAQDSLTVTSESATIIWEIPESSTGMLATCAVTVNVNGIIKTDRSTENNEGISTALASQKSSIESANLMYPESLTANSKAYQKALIDNRTRWRKDTNRNREEYKARVAEIKSSPSTAAKRLAATKALNNFSAARKKIADEYFASKPAALAAKNTADKQALERKNAAISNAIMTYGAFIESLGYGVLIP
jgi:hypothetical protein